MNGKRKSLLCMYVDNFCGIEKESFNFYIQRRYIINEGKISRKNDEEIEDFPKNFWGKNVSAMTLLIGENGAGKTTLMRLLIKWLCQLSAGNIPMEKGALVISVGREDKLIAFDNGKLWTLNINKNIENLYIANQNEMKKMLSDVRLAYYTDTMTDLELGETLAPEELKFLHDDSLLTRLSNSMKGRYAIDSIKDCIKREDFQRQMAMYLYSKKKSDSEPDRKSESKQESKSNKMPEFPIRYMKFTAINAGDEKSFKRVSDGNKNLIREMIYFWNEVCPNIVNDCMSVIARDLLWGVFSGTITSLLKWERTLPNLEKSIVTESVTNSISEYIRMNAYDWNTFFKRFLANVFRDCEREFGDTHCYKEFCTEWNKEIRDNINGFLNVLKETEEGEFFDQWTPFENAKNVWEFKMEHFDKKVEDGKTNLIENWGNLWEHYLTVAHFMPECRFDWKYASSGGKNKSNLYANLFSIVENNEAGRKQLWFLLDEPDNTFHPDWEREIIQDILEKCSDFNIYFQLLISTHSPIMLSDVPKQAAILLKTVEKEEKGDKIERKQQVFPENSPFGQQIYTLFKDAFFMKDGVIGAFANGKIEKIYKQFYKIEEWILKGEIIQDKVEGEEFSCNLDEYKTTIKLVEEPLLHGLLSQNYKLYNRRMKELQKDNLRKEGDIND